MSNTAHFDEIEIFDDATSDLDILRKIIDRRQSEKPIHMLNVGDVLKKHQVWLKKLPRIVPYYAVKCNPNPTVIKLLAALNGHFDCASKQEIIQVMSTGVSSDRIIFANPIKFSSHIEYAKKVGVSMMTVDTENEIRKIKRIYPEAKILIRIRCDTKVTSSQLGLKFGCDPEKDAYQLINASMTEGMELCGFSFHVGSPCHEPSAICRGILLCKGLIDFSRSLGCASANIIDIGGGIPGKCESVIDEFSDAINAVLRNVDHSIKIIAEPGRYYVASASIAAACVLNKKQVVKNGRKVFMYYVTDGVYGTFMEELLGAENRHPCVLNDKKYANEETYVSTIWGPTCDSVDCILEEILLPEINMGDWLAWFNMGAYAICTSTKFNGIEPAVVYPVMRRADWLSMWQDITEGQQNGKGIPSNIC